jgi:hypothetical protein
MVRRDEKRMQKMQKRMDDVELIQNNVKLLNELLIHLKEESGEQERLLAEVGRERVSLSLSLSLSLSPPLPNFITHWCCRNSTNP